MGLQLIPRPPPSPGLNYRYSMNVGPGLRLVEQTLQRHGSRTIPRHPGTDISGILALVTITVTGIGTIVMENSAAGGVNDDVNSTFRRIPAQMLSVRRALLGI